MAQLFHVGLTVKNPERSLAFYRYVVEMTEKEHLEARSKAFDTLTWCWCESESRFKIELPVGGAPPSH